MAYSFILYQSLKQCHIMRPKVLVLTTTDPGNPFPENFSCWCAGALEAKGCRTALETISLEKCTHTSASKPLEIKREQLMALRSILSIIEKLVLILPEYNNMIPVGLDNFIELVSTIKNKYKLCQLIAIVMDPSTHANNTSHLLFRYPLHKLDLFLGSTFSTDRIQIKNSPTGNMCPLFAASYSDLFRMVQQILA